MDFLLPVALFGLIALMMFSGRKKQRAAAQQQEQLQNAAVPGARIMTSSGLHGTITAVADDTIELEVAPGVYTTWARAAIREVIVPVLDETDENVDDAAPAIAEGEDQDQPDAG